MSVEDVCFLDIKGDFMTLQSMSMSLFLQSIQFSFLAVFSSASSKALSYITHAYCTFCFTICHAHVENLSSIASQTYKLTRPIRGTAQTLQASFLKRMQSFWFSHPATFCLETAPFNAI